MCVEPQVSLPTLGETNKQSKNGLKGPILRKKEVISHIL
jgi:hypothetical protein